MSWRSGRKTGLAALPVEGRLPGFDGANGWLNSSPLSTSDVRGKVVLVDFWTYTCINWLRTLGHLRAWAEKYREQGLVVVGVHTPEFPFERDADNVRQAVTEMRIEYPIALDPDYAVWSAFSNRYWPAAYFADAEGRIRHHQFGEGEYEMCERVIQQLLRDAGQADVAGDVVSPPDEGVEAQADWSTLESPETYVGYQQGHNFASAGGVSIHESRAYSVPETLKLNSWALSGKWTVESRATVLDEAGGAIAFRFHARDVNLVLRSRTGNAVPFRVRVDGAPPGAAHGLDVGAEGNGTLSQPRLYQLVRHQGSIADRTFEITFLEPGVEAYVFTFG
jgi:thiol-disulfide isomerase/thioredoxin